MKPGQEVPPQVLGPVTPAAHTHLRTDLVWGWSLCSDAIGLPSWGLVYIRVPKRNRPIGCIEREKEIYYRELAPTIMEVGKSPDLQSTSWRPRSSQSFSSSLEAGKEQRSSSAVRQKGFLLVGLSVLFMPSTD